MLHRNSFFGGIKYLGSLDRLGHVRLSKFALLVLTWVTLVWLSFRVSVDGYLKHPDRLPSVAPIEHAPWNNVFSTIILYVH